MLTGHQLTLRYQVTRRNAPPPLHLLSSRLDRHQQCDIMAPATAAPDTGPAIDPDTYIPVGCLVTSSSQDLKPSLAWQSLHELSQARWIRVQQLVRVDELFTVARVYVLPDDMENARVNRSSALLRRKRRELLASLDVSAKTWDASVSNGHQATLKRIDDDDNAAHQDMSLLQMFNSIPSPTPDIAAIKDPLSRSFMSNLLASTVDNLVTELYPYQCRSAALMHQRETAPARYPDPRYREVLDQSSKVYYYDSATGEIRREPRHYDASRGGILAEEMGAGKTLICLALIAATKHQSAEVPDLYQGNNTTIRPRIASLMDMAAAVATKHACPWGSYLDSGYEHCIQAIKRNPGWYHLPRPQSRRRTRTSLTTKST